MDAYARLCTITEEFARRVSTHAYAQVQCTIPPGAHTTRADVPPEAVAYGADVEFPPPRCAVVEISVRGAHSSLGHPCGILLEGVPPSYRTCGASPPGPGFHAVIPAHADGWWMDACYTEQLPRRLLEMHDALDIDALGAADCVDPGNGRVFYVRNNTPLDLMCLLDKRYSPTPAADDVAALPAGFRAHSRAAAIGALTRINAFADAPLVDLARLAVAVTVLAPPGTPPAEQGAPLSFELHLRFVPAHPAPPPPRPDDAERVSPPPRNDGRDDVETMEMGITRRDA